MTTPTYSASIIAKYFLLKAQDEGQELISNLKLQKLVYYAQGLHLTLEGTPLFKDKIEAWEYGPVVPSLYQEYKKHGARGIPADKLFNISDIDSNTIKFLDEIYKVFGQFSAIRLMDLAHTDQCWIDARPKNGTITHRTMKESLKKYLKNG